MIDPVAATYGLHDSLVIPIGAKTRDSIERFVGAIEQSFGNDQAFLVSFRPHGLPNDLPVWKLEKSLVLHSARQLWVDINSRKYRSFYQQVFGELVKDGDQVIDHIMNRRLARALQYRYVRLLHVSRSANSSSGKGGESLAVDFLPMSMSLNPAISSSEIVYADPMDLLKMMDIKVGGFGLDAVRDHHYLFYS